LYLASGRFVLATNVGEAARVLPPDMLVTYNGSSDHGYTERLAQAVARRIDAPRQCTNTVLIAETCFSYDILAEVVRARLAALSA
jgi:hypothetical protein